MDVESLDLWPDKPPKRWVRDLVGRWADLLRRTALLYMELFDAAPLPRTETEVLLALFAADGASESSRLAAELHVTRQTMTGLVDHLEKAGYVVRGPNPDDRRRKVVALTEAGRGIVSSVAARALRRDAAFAASQPRKEVESHVAFFERFVSRIESRNAGRRPKEGEE